LLTMNLHAVAAVAVKLFLGSGNYLFQKVLSSTCGQPLYTEYPIDPKSKCEEGTVEFGKPFFLTSIVFLSMSCSLIYFVLFRKKHVDKSTYSRKALLNIAAPGFMECGAFALGVYAQILMDLSLAMIMKGAKVVFSALLSVLILRRRLFAYHWIAVCLCLAGLTIAGASEFLNNKDSTTTILIGSALLLGSELLKAFRVILDERLMKDVHCDATLVVGMEGLYSMMIMVPFIILAWTAIPGKEGGALEDLADTFHRLGENPMMIGLISVYPITLLIAAIAGALVTKYLSAVHNAMVSVSRSIVIWLVELLLFYCGTVDIATHYGKGWKEFTWVKLIGFVLVVVSTLIYDGFIKLPFLDYSHAQPVIAPEEEEKDVRL